MRKSQILKLLPDAKNLAQELKARQKAFDKEGTALDKLHTLVNELHGVEVVETSKGPFPVRVCDIGDDSVEVFSAADEVERYALIVLGGDSEYGVDGFRSATDDGEDIGTFRTFSAAKRAATSFVAIGKIEILAAKKPANA